MHDRNFSVKKFLLYSVDFLLKISFRKAFQTPTLAFLFSVIPATVEIWVGTQMKDLERFVIKM